MYLHVRCFSNSRLILWPGFSTSVLRYETQILLSVDISHKVLRNETVLDFMIELYNRVGDQHFSDTCMKELVGFVVLTRYNNKTYRIDDIDWSVKPTNKFKKADGTEITYVDYYSQQYNASITDLKQPMLVSQLKSKNRFKDMAPRLAHLVPEFCFLTGLSSQARSDFQIMKDLAAETQLSPQKRQKRLHELIDNIQRNKVTRTELEGWGLRLDEQISLVGRVLPPEKIQMFDHSCQPVSPVDWSRDTRKSRIIGSQPLQDWLMVFSHRNYEVAGQLLACLKKVGPPMGFLVDNPKMKDKEALERMQIVKPGAVNKWLEVNHELPSRIVIYRDGVGDGQLMTLVDYEVPQILDSFKMVHSTYSPKVTIIVVRKKGTCRFFANVNGLLQNPPVGTVIDSEATHPEWYDFFQISQCAHQGTVSPTYYHVVYDNSSMKPDHVQRLTYKMCHLYYNWPGVIRVPAPCQYAFKLTTLVAQNVHREPDLELADRLFFL
ncbi:piwi-like protein 4 [Rhincodon typus]|uniref:piwi-like protein 4 n=1 Tax=Rhincodon typus TaxID=259920 RepID=UPI00202DC65E|nr:piwi-like protein 4 [Rhincodon typus]